ncbi:probable E3 ubiquitin-protein ligase HIP1 [Hibiscus syriacus]|uniref:probable E3 ubiquitin-protein ligase HIP1 n=1 Tax=Hibiscus syriacus TaxID=106335 RepID=UPI0019241FD9|nr:probable E3 ubiquitin-protein ligase HIP1 [Hibiscus syriacus]
MQGQGHGSNASEDPTLRLLLQNNGMDPNDGHISGNHGTTAQTILSGQGQGIGYGRLQLDLNEPLQLTVDLPRTGRTSGNQQILASFDSLSPIMIHSGSAGYVVEETINREGLLLTNGQSRLLCKRRASKVPQPQNAVLNIPTAASSSNNGSHLARPVLPVATSPIHIGQMDSYQSNTRLRTFLSQQNPGPVNTSAWNSSNFNAQATGPHRQRPVVSPFGSLSTQNSQIRSVPANPSMLHHQQQPTVGVSNQLQQLTVGIPNQSQQQNIVGAHNPMQTPLSSQNWNVPAMPSHGHQSFGSAVTIQPGNVQPNMNLVNGNSSFVGNAAASSRIQSGSGWRITIPYTDASHTIRDLEAALRSNNYRPTQVPQRSGAIAAERQAGNNIRLSRTMSSQMTAQRRRRLISQMRSYLRLVRRSGGLRTEDATEMGRSFLQTMYALETTHDDMRLDIDNMSYEELLDLENRMGNVSTGLSQATIQANLRRRKFQPITIAPTAPTAETEQCCICQEDYADGEELGKLDCGHDFHFNCIKQWFGHKNLCPVCKKTALAI